MCLRGVNSGSTC
uniref:Uncharacterized protein n=1 Tax=Arundo donax TaxID=35708 RepID=A0A0A8Y7B5_ARUDO